MSSTRSRAPRTCVGHDLARWINGSVEDVADLTDAAAAQVEAEAQLQNLGEREQRG